MKRLVLGLLVALAGCEAYEDVGGSITVLQKDVSASNGIAMNGFNTNGLKLNGYNLNGYNLNGKYNNGKYTNGFYKNGKYTNGAWVNGAWVNGAYVNGLKLNGLNLNGVNFNGAYPNGAYVNGAWVNGAWVNGAWVNGAYVNGAWVNGAYNNGAYANGQYNNGYNMNGAWVNGLNANGAYPNGLSLNGADSATTQNHLTYLTKCAWPANSTLSVTVNDQTYTFAGALNLAPNFANGEMTKAERQAVSACLEAFTNVAGEHVLISMREKADGGTASFPLLAADGGEVSTFKYVESWFFGDHFDDENSTEYLVSMRGYFRDDNGRACSKGSPFSGITQCGFQAQQNTCDADGNCTHVGDATTYKGVLTYQQLEPFWTGYCNPAAPVPACNIAKTYPNSYYYNCDGTRNTYDCP